jgi:hypothetical protein
MPRRNDPSVIRGSMVEEIAGVRYELSADREHADPLQSDARLYQ